MKKILVTTDTFEHTIDLLSEANMYGFDTETYGLKEADKLFAMIFATHNRVLYFNFHKYPNMLKEHVLPREWIQKFKYVFANPNSAFCISNAKFDMAMLAKEGVDVTSNIVCTNAIGRVLKNNHMAYGLAASAERIGLVKKTDLIEKSITANKYFEYELIPGKKKRVQNRQYWKVDFDTMFEYACEDAILHLELGKYLAAEIEKIPEIQAVAQNEVALTKVCFKMERTGIKLRRDYTENALALENAELNYYKREYESLTGSPYSESNKAFKEIFNNLGINYEFSEKGNGVFNEKALSKIQHPVAEKILQIRNLDKRIGTYYSSFLYYADKNHIIHPQMNQGGTETGRFSYSNPNLQNVPKEDEPGKQYYVRGCFAPRDDYYFVAIDYSQQEYRLMLDYAGEHTLIEQINNGADVHQAMADMVGITRQQAKTLNFACLYGAGEAKIAQMLKLSQAEAGHLLGMYYAKLPKVAAFKKSVIQKGQSRGYIFNWAGRRCHIAQRDWAYILPNHLIQGGGADIIKFAMVQMDPLFAGTRSRPVLQIHDEILLEIHKDELELIPGIISIMEGVYKPKNNMKLTTSVSHSAISWGYNDMINGTPKRIPLV
jgi:DNA polymerase I